jgi:hypothetical protein
MNGEEFELQFTTFPLSRAVVIWNLDISSVMTFGSRFEEGNEFDPSENTRLSSLLLSYGILPDYSNPSQTLRQVWRELNEPERSELLRELRQFTFRYEPWESALEMLQGFWTETGLCEGMLGLVSGPGGSMMVHSPCLAPRQSMEALVEHGPAGWYEFALGLTETLNIATHYAHEGYPVDVFVVNRGPAWDEERDQIPEFIDRALAAGIRIHAVPMGNEPGRRTRFPYLKPLQELAEGTGGQVYYEPNLDNIYDYSMLPRMVSRMMRDYYQRMERIDRGALVARRASLVIVPSEHVQILAPPMTAVATNTAGVSFSFQDLRIGEPQSVNVRLRVSTNVTQTLLPIFRGSTKWTDAEYSYFEWVDQTGHLHRLPLPQRIISVTTSPDHVEPPPDPTQIPTREPEPSPIPSPTPSPMPSPTSSPIPSPTSSPRPSPTSSPTATPTPSPTPSNTPSPPASPTATATLRASPTAGTESSPPAATPTMTIRAADGNHRAYVVLIAKETRGR